MAQTLYRRIGHFDLALAILLFGALTLAASPPTIAASPSNVIVPISKGSPAYAVARRQLDLFLSESKSLHAAYLAMRASPSAERLAALEARWQTVSSRIYNTAEFAGIEFLGLRELELAVSRNWRDYLSIHAAGLRTNDKKLIELSAAHLAFAEALEALVPQFVN